MMKRTILALSAALPALATELPPTIPGGSVTYDFVDYETPVYEPAPAPAPAIPAYAPETPSVSSGQRGYVTITPYSNEYTVRGMGLTDGLTDYGYSLLSGSYVLPNQNLFGRGIYQRISGAYGVILGKGDALGERPLFNANYALGKEIFPNLTAELGYSLRYGGLEGFMAKHYDGAPHSASHDVNFSLRFNDGQKGFFGSMTWGLGFSGLNGIYGDIELGYRFTDVISGALIGADLELSAGIAPSFSYWTDGADGIDAYRIRIALPLYTHSGTMGRDAKLHVTPWIQASKAGSNGSKIDDDLGYDAIDSFTLSAGVDVSWHF